MAATTTNFEKHTSKNPLKKFFINNYFNNFLELISDLKIETVLDAGCGEGFTLNKLKQNGIGQKYEGIDYSEDAIKLGRKIYPNLDIKKGDIYNLLYKENSFDLIICTEVLEHLDDPQKALSDILRVSSRYILLTVPNEPWFTLFNFTQWGKDIGHINHWSSFSFQKFIIHNSKFRILRKKHPFPWTMILAEK